MTAFTVLGLLAFWWFCWEVGYCFAMWLDVRDGINALLAPVTSEIEVLIAALSERSRND